VSGEASESRLSKFRCDPIFLVIGDTIRIDASIAPIFSTGKLALSPFPSFHVAYSVAINTIWACWIIFLAVWLLAAIAVEILFVTPSRLPCRSLTKAGHVEVSTKTESNA